jgi:hypothetical protein
MVYRLSVADVEGLDTPNDNAYGPIRSHAIDANNEDTRGGIVPPRLSSIDRGWDDDRHPGFPSYDHTPGKANRKSDTFPKDNTLAKMP